MGVARNEVDRAVRELMHFSALLHLADAMRRRDFKGADDIAENLIRARQVIYKDDPLAQDLLLKGVNALRSVNMGLSIEDHCSRLLVQHGGC